MINSIIEVFIYCVLAHYIADYILQTPFIAKFKCKESWEKEYPDKLYKNDYKVVLWTHSLCWSIVTFLPLYLMIALPAWKYLIIIVFQAYAHYIVDDAKANERLISLKADQIIHLIQIFIIVLAYVIRYYN